MKNSKGILRALNQITDGFTALAKEVGAEAAHHIINRLHFGIGRGGGSGSGGGGGGGGPEPSPSPGPGTLKRKRRKMSAAGRAKIAAAQKARWAKLKGK